MRGMRMLVVALALAACDPPDSVLTGVAAEYSGMRIMPSWIRSDGRETTDLVMRIRDHEGELLGGAEVTLRAQSDITIEPDHGFTDELGSFVARVGPSTVQGDVRVIADVEGVELQAYVGFSLAPMCDSVHFQYTLPLAVAGRRPLLVDFTGDQKPDLVTRSNDVADTIITAASRGDGTFASAASIAAGPYATTVTAEPVTADLNGDGARDLLTPNAVVLANSNGGFAAPQPFGATTIASDVAGGLINAGTIIDAVVADAGGGIRVYLGNGDGTMQTAIATATPFASSTARLRLAIGDIDRDGASDLVVIDGETKALWLLRGAGNGSFAAASQIALSYVPSEIVVGDLDVDGDLDAVLATVNPPFTGGIEVLRGDGNGAFATWLDAMTYLTASDLLLTDLDGDARLDIAVGGIGQDGYEVVTWAVKPTIFAGPNRSQLASGAGMAIADIDSDGVVDLAVGGITGTTITHGFNGLIFPRRKPYAMTAASSITSADRPGYRGNASVATLETTDQLMITETVGSDIPDVHLVAVGDGPRGIAIADVDQDGIADAITAHRFDVTLSLGQEAYGVEYGPPMLVRAGTRPTITVADFDNDRRRDLLVADLCVSCEPVSVTASFLRGNGDGTFAAPVPVHSSTESWLRTIAADVDRDGNQDVIVGRYPNAGAILLRGRGDGSFDDPRPIGATGDSLAVADVNDDGMLDLITNTPAPVAGLPPMHRGTLVFLGIGDGGFASPLELVLAGEPNVTVADLNRDGPLDLIGAGDGFIDVALGVGDGTFREYTRFPTQRTGAASFEAVDAYDSGYYSIVTSTGTMLNEAPNCGRPF